jgi:peptidoglycan/xylan/chitin deacetylase (PgdA/CDA1 family)
MTMKEPIKALIGRSIFRSRLHTALLHKAAVVVAFHRVRDTRQPDALSIGVQTFERYCRFFQRHFRVVPLRELVDKLERGAAPDHELAITFDDGYRDNFENAAPLLERFSLPATFFVVSQWIGTDVVPWWDQQEGVQYPWMSWSDVRSLHRRGFDIGGHTRTHVDLGVVDEATAGMEILGARFDLETQLDATVDMFAYPYGRQNNVTEGNRVLVQNAGFRCCCSCFGGTVGAGTDPFHLARIPISSHQLSPHQFGFELALGRSVLHA